MKRENQGRSRANINLIKINIIPTMKENILKAGDTSILRNERFTYNGWSTITKQTLRFMSNHYENSLINKAFDEIIYLKVFLSEIIH